MPYASLCPFNLVHKKTQHVEFLFCFFFLETSGKTHHGSDLCFRKYGPCGGLNNGPQRLSRPDPGTCDCVALQGKGTLQIFIS